MIINYKNNKLKKQCNDFSIAKKDFGTDIATKLFQRLNELESSNNLKEMSFIKSSRFHELSGNRKGQFAVKLTGNYRLVFIADDGNIQLEKIEKIKLEEIVDYH